MIVAIADVAAFVTPDSPLDREALKRGNSTYFPDRVVPMLPFELSADACSLREGELRRCMAVEMIFDKAGTIELTHMGDKYVCGKISAKDSRSSINGEFIAKMVKK